MALAVGCGDDEKEAHQDVRDLDSLAELAADPFLDSGRSTPSAVLPSLPVLDQYPRPLAWAGQVDRQTPLRHSGVRGDASDGFLLDSDCSLLGSGSGWPNSPDGTLPRHPLPETEETKGSIQQ